MKTQKKASKEKGNDFWKIVNNNKLHLQLWQADWKGETLSKLISTNTKKAWESTGSHSSIVEASIPESQKHLEIKVKKALHSFNLIKDVCIGRRKQDYFYYKNENKQLNIWIIQSI